MDDDGKLSSGIVWNASNPLLFTRFLSETIIKRRQKGFTTDY